MNDEENRQKFEKWCMDNIGVFQGSDALIKSDNGDYFYAGVQNLWKCWQEAQRVALE